MDDHHLRSEKDDAELIELIRNRDEYALEELMQVYSPTMLRIAEAITGSKEVAQEVVQDIFIRLWKYGPDLSIQASLKKYLWGAVRNQAMNMSRYERVRTRISASLVELTKYAPRVSINPALQEIEAKELLGQMEDLLGKVPRQCREIFLLHHRDDMKAEDIAEALGISLRTVQNQLARARRYLSEEWDRSR